jgi:hypothetical protein
MDNSKVRHLDPTSTDATLLRIWNLLEEATRGRSPFNFMQLATVARNGAPKLRTVVIRDFRQDDCTIAFTADARSSKIEEIQNDARVAVVALDAGGGIQLRVEGRAELATDPPRRLDAWSKLKARSHVLFRSSLAPGSKLQSPLDAAPNTPWETSSHEPLEHFALLLVHIERMDWLEVNSEPHQRCQFQRSGSLWTGTWIAP